MSSHAEQIVEGCTHTLRTRTYGAEPNWKPGACAACIAKQLTTARQQGQAEERELGYRCFECKEFISNEDAVKHFKLEKNKEILRTLKEHRDEALIQGWAEGLEEARKVNHEHSPCEHRMRGDCEQAIDDALRTLATQRRTGG